MNLLSFKCFKSLNRNRLKFLLSRRCSSYLSVLRNIDIRYRIINTCIIKFIIRISSNWTPLIINPKRLSWTWSICYSIIGWSSNNFKGRVKIFGLSCLRPSEVLSWRFEKFLLFFIWSPRWFLDSWIILSFLPSFSFRISFRQTHSCRRSSLLLVL